MSCHQERKNWLSKKNFFTAVLILYRHSPIWKYYSKEPDMSTVKLSSAHKHLVSPVLVWNLVSLFHEDLMKHSPCPTPRKWSNTVVKPIVSSQPCPDSEHNAWTHEAADCYSLLTERPCESGLASTMHPVICYLARSKVLIQYNACAHSAHCLSVHIPTRREDFYNPKWQPFVLGSVPTRNRKETCLLSAFYLLGCWSCKAFIWAKDLSLLVLFIQTSCARY